MAAKSQKKSPRLGVNIDHVATLRRLRDTPYPDLGSAAAECVKGGANQITVHLREDRRHIVDSDVVALKRDLSVDLNLEIAVTQEMKRFALKLKPHSICLVPEKRAERTTEGGLNLSSKKKIREVHALTLAAAEKKILVSLFIEPSVRDIETAAKIGAHAVELHTGALCLAFQRKQKTNFEKELSRFYIAARFAHDCGLLVHAGHGIDRNTARILRKNRYVIEYNIGHAIVCDAMNWGLRLATRKMKEALSS